MEGVSFVFLGKGQEKELQTRKSRRGLAKADS